MNLRRILFPVDFSDGARAVAPFIHSMAQRHQTDTKSSTHDELPAIASNYYGVMPSARRTLAVFGRRPRHE